MLRVARSWQAGAVTGVGRRTLAAAKAAKPAAAKPDAKGKAKGKDAKEEAKPAAVGADAKAAGEGARPTGRVKKDKRLDDGW
jgi:hypothetical protein